MLGVPYAELLSKFEKLRRESAEKTEGLNEELDQMTTAAKTLAAELKRTQEAYAELEEEAAILGGQYSIAIDTILELRNELTLMSRETKEYDVLRSKLAKSERLVEQLEEENREVYGRLYNLQDEHWALQEYVETLQILAKIIGGVQ